MSTQNTQKPDAEATRGSAETDRLSRSKRLFSTIAERGRNGMVAALAGGILLTGAVRRAGQDRRRAGMLALSGGALLGVGIRQRRSDDATSTADEGTVSTDASANLERADVLHQSETNPRGVSGEPDVETETDPEAGDIRFTTEQEGSGAEPKPRLDGEEDPRVFDEDDPETTDDHVDIDLSEAAMADEASEATGPADEQSYPALEGTDPEPMSDRAPKRYGKGTGADTGENSPGDASEAGSESVEDEETT